MDLKQFRTDKSKEESGTWIEYGDARLLIASAKNPSNTKALRRRLKSVPQTLIDSGAESVKRTIAEVTAEHVLLSWEGIELDGKPLEPTVENRKKVMVEIEPFAEWVTAQALDIANFQAEDEAESVAALKSGDPVDS